MSASNIVKHLMIERGIHAKDLALCLDIQEQSLYNKLSRDSFTYKEMEKIADYFNCDIQLVTRDTNKVFK